MVTYIRSDLDFVLQQIKISELHAAGQPLYGVGGLIPAYNIAWGLRTVDGTYNHLLPGQEEWGSSDEPFSEHLGTDFMTVMVDVDPGPGVMMVPMSYAPSTADPDGAGPGVAGDVMDGSVRTISNLLVDQTLDNPAAILTALQRAGIVAPADQMSVTGTIGAAYDVVKPLFAAVTAADLVNAAAQAAAAANPGDAGLDAAAAAAAADLAAAQAALAGPREALDALLAANGVELDGANVKLTNIAPDEGLSASFNSWFTLFGQFFDHGLDLVGKGGSGTVFIPLQPDDPLYVEGGDTNFMVLTRATVAPGDDGVFGTADDVRPLNTTTAYVDQNQTYASHASHQVFLRQYEFNADGKPVATGMLMVGRGPDGIRGTVDDGGMATWADLKAQAAELLGIQLLDVNVGNIPLLATDEYGNFLPGANGFPQIVTESVLVEGDPDANGGLGVLLPANTIFTGHAFLADIAHNAVPDGIGDGDTEVGGNIPEDGFYDDELLDAHFMAGDGRVNENIGLTAVHHVFHAEHNRLVQHTKDVVLADAAAMVADGATQAEAVAFLNEWLVDDVAAVPGSPDGLVWDGERLFQAAKFGTEMQYQHLVFEEFARKVSPSINGFLVPDGFDTTMDPSIVAEFAHVVYRFGHSMLTESVDRFDPAFQEDHISLIEGFLNPLQFQNNGTNSAVDADIAAGAIIRGMTRQVGNEIDEFVTSALRNNLLGLPLDLATINLARGRDTGVPTLNAVREQFYDASNQNILLKPYESWVDYAGHLKNEASIINFIAAYGTHELITGQTMIDGKRDAALTIITGVSVGGLDVPANAEDFLNGLGEFADDLGGLNDIDLWIGGLAEEIMPFGGMLGSTFGYVFEIQLEMLQSGDRFYYLQRLDGLHLFGEMESNSFAAMIMRNTDATHLPADVFSTPGLILEVDQANQFNLGTGVFTDVLGNGLGDDPGTLDIDEGADDVENTNADPLGSGLLTNLVTRNNPSTAGPDDNYLRYTGGDHVVLGGTEDNDILIAGIGDDTLYGDGGNDRLDGGFGNDILNGGDGDDIIVDAGGDDNIKGGAGNDVIHAGPGLDLVLAGSGNDFVFLGTDEGSEVFAGEGDDFIYGNKNAERILGNEGNDWIETGTFDGAPGDNFDEVFAHDGIDGHDVFLGDGGFDEFIGEGGDDIMVGSAGRGKMAGMSGFDWAIYKDNTIGVNADLSIPIVFDEAPQLPTNTALDEYASMEGLSGSAHDDILKGSNVLAEERLPNIVNGTEGLAGNLLELDDVQRIANLDQVVGNLVTATTGYSAGDIILGGDGSDEIWGQMGDDVIDGDKWLDVQIGVYAPGDVNHTGDPIALHNSMTTLAAAMFAGTINPGQLAIVRTIRDDDTAGDVDTAVFSDIFSNYTITHNPDGTTTVAHTTVSDGLESDGVDRLRNIEQLRFADLTIQIEQNSTGQPTISDTTPTEGQGALTVDTDDIEDPDGIVSAFSYQWQSSADGLTWADIGGATGPSFTPDNNAGQTFGDHADLHLRVVVSFTDGNGINEVTVSDPTAPVGVDWDGNDNANTLNGTRGDDIADAGDGNDILNGGEGDDDLDGGDDADTITGGGGDDLIAGAGGNDTAVFSGPVANYSFGQIGNNLTVTDDAGLDDTDTLTSIQNLRFGVQTLGLVQGTGGNNNVDGNTAANLVLGHGGNDNIDAGTGNDVIDGGTGNDTIEWNANTASGANNNNGDGRDIVRGGDGTDTYEVNGNNNSEAYRLYTRTAALAAGITDIAAATEIVVTRAGANNASIIGELESIEEIVINSAGGGGDNFQVFGDFTGTSLDLNTITFNGGSGDDTVDISGLQSPHRIVFASGGGSDTLVGDLRSQDVLQLPTGSDPSGYTMQTVNGQTILSNGEHSIVFTGVAPNVSVAVDADPGDDTSGDDVIVGDETNELFFGGAGSDYIDGGLGIDMAAFADEIHAYTFGSDGELLQVTDVQGAADTLVGVEWLSFAGLPYNLTAGSGADDLSLNNSAGSANVVLGFGGHDVLHGGAGDDVLVGGDGDDFLDGDLHSDILIGGAGIDTAHFRGSVGDFVLDGGDAILVNHIAGAQGNDTLTGVEWLSFDGVSYRVLEGSDLNDVSLNNSSGSANAVFAGSGNDSVNGGAGDDLISGGDGADELNGGLHSDHIFGNGGDDLVVQFASESGRDLIDGGDGLDTYRLVGGADAEAFTIYTRTAALGAFAGLTLQAGTEIVVTRNGQVIAELDNIEEIEVDSLAVSANDGNGAPNGGSSNGDVIEIVGDFNETSLNFNTVTINGAAGADKIDISALTSAHRVVFKSNGGEDTVVGTPRPQDVFDLEQDLGSYYNPAYSMSVYTAADDQAFLLGHGLAARDPSDRFMEKAPAALMAEEVFVYTSSFPGAAKSMPSQGSAVDWEDLTDRAREIVSGENYPDRMPDLDLFDDQQIDNFGSDYFL